MANIIIEQNLDYFQRCSPREKWHLGSLSVDGGCGLAGYI